MRRTHAAYTVSLDHQADRAELCYALLRIAAAPGRGMQRGGGQLYLNGTGEGTGRATDLRPVEEGRKEPGLFHLDVAVSPLAS